MSEYGHALPAATLVRLRAAFDPQVMVEANVSATAQAAPALATWASAVGDAFYGGRAGGALEPRERELCLVALLANMGLQLPLAVHVYWALMEGVEAGELEQVVGLAACYGGLARFGPAILTVQRVVALLGELPVDDCGSASVLRALIVAFGSQRA